MSRLNKSFAEFYPELIKEWNNSRNGPQTPYNTSFKSHKKIWWICKNGHQWEQIVSKRGHKGKGCSVCRSLGFNNPKIALEIDNNKNNLDPFKLFNGSNKKIWWICKKGHSWYTQISTRTRVRSAGCPFCHYMRNGKITDKKLLKEWDFKQNKNINIENVSKNSKIKVHWICSVCDNKWEARIDNRFSGSKCPKCALIRKVKDNKSVSAVAPHLLKEWSCKNLVKPENLSYGSHKKVLWKCLKGHEWEESPKHRILSNTKCPFCSGKRVCKENSLFYNNPELFKEWHPIKNGKLTPKNFTAHSGKIAWWVCSFCGHEWKAVISNRSKGIGCPECCKNVHLKDGTTCDSLTEAFFYLKLKKSNINFLYQYHYPGFGKHRCDFYVPCFNLYIEVTGYNKESQRFPKYELMILKKKKYTEKTLKANFVFIQYFLNRSEYKYVKSFVKKYNKNIKGYKI